MLLRFGWEIGFWEIRRTAAGLGINGYGSDAYEFNITATMFLTGAAMEATGPRGAGGLLGHRLIYRPGAVAGD